MPAQLEVRPGRTLNVERHEPGGAFSGVTVFLTHGAGGNAAQWRFVRPGLLEAGHRVVAFDALGHGLSPAPRTWRGYAGRETAADLQALVAAQGSARNWLVGHSLGTWVTLQALIDGTQAVERAVLLAPPGPGMLDRTPWITYLPVPLLERMRPQLSAGFRAVAWGPSADPALVDEETAISDRNPFHVFKAMWRQRLQLDAAALAAVTLPVQMLAGAEDRLTPAAGAEALAAALPNARLELLRGCGHQLMLEQPGAVLRALLA